MKAEQSPDSAAPTLGSAVAADDGSAAAPMPGAALAQPVDPLEWTPENIPCLRDCRYYFHTVGHFDAQNSGRRFVEHTHACMRIPGVWLEMSADAPAYDCDWWDPLDDREIHRLQLRRQEWLGRKGITLVPLEERLHVIIEEELDVDEPDDPEPDSPPEGFYP